MAVLTQSPPPDIERALLDTGVPAEERRLCTCTDIDRVGHYRPQWLVATDDEVLVMDGGDGAALLHRLTFDQLHEVRTQSGVGAGLLQARVEATDVDLLRYSNRLADRFEKVARKLDGAVRGEPIVVHPDENVDKEPEGPSLVEKGTVLRRILGLMRPYARSAGAMMGLLLVGIALDLVSPQLTRILVDDVLPGSREAAADLQASPGVYGEHLQLLVVIVLVLAAVQILRQTVNVFNGRLSSKVGTAITFDMRRRLVDHLQKLSVSYYDRQQVGSLVGRVAYDTEALQGFVNQLTSGFLFQLIMLVGVGVVMFVMDAKIAAFALLPAPLVIAGSVVFWRYLYPRYYKTWDASSKQAGMLSGVLSGIRVVKAFSQEQRELDKFNAVSQRLRDSRRGVDMGMATFNPIMGVVFQLGGWIVWFVGGRDVLRGTLTLGELMAFFGYLWMFYGPLGMLTQFTNWLTQFLTQANRMFEVLDAPVQIAEKDDPVRVGLVDGRIDFEQVHFGYQPHDPVLKGVDLLVKPGEFIGVVGRSGSGKSTIINLMCRFYDVESGAVRIDGHDVRDLHKGDIRRNIGVVLQEPFLFRGSIWENLTYGLSEANPEQVFTAAMAANCHEFIMAKAHGYDTWVGERGAGLSGGERQRVSIARVLLTDPRILILDEATSSVDAESEAAIHAALQELVKGRTTIAVAHRLSTLRSADRIVVVDAGRIAEVGSHDQLLAQNGAYARLVRLQGAYRSIEENAEDARTPEDEATSVIKPRWLTPARARIHLGSHDALHVTVQDDRIYAGVYAVRCMPVHAPEQYISLRCLDSQKRTREVGIIQSLTDWPEDARRLIEESLLKRYFIHEVTGVRSVTPISTFLKMQLDTDRGPMAITLRNQSDRAQDYGHGGKMLIDLDENRFLIPDVDQLPERDRRLFRRYIYW